MESVRKLLSDHVFHAGNSADLSCSMNSMIKYTGCQVKKLDTFFLCAIMAE